MLLNDQGSFKVGECNIHNFMLGSLITGNVSSCLTHVFVVALEDYAMACLLAWLSRTCEKLSQVQ